LILLAVSALLFTACGPVAPGSLDYTVDADQRGDEVVVSGTVTNAGSRPVDEVIVAARFVDEQGHTIPGVSGTDRITNLRIGETQSFRMTVAYDGPWSDVGVFLSPR